MRNGFDDKNRPAKTRIDKLINDYTHSNDKNCFL
jgi:hypothetical protein